MAEFEVKIVRVDDVIEHPDADRLTIVKIGGYRCIANKLEDGTWRYQKGDLVIYIPEGSVLQEWMLRDLNMWNEAEGKGFLAGSDGNRVRAIKLRGVVSQGVLMPVRVEEQTLKNGSTWYYLSFQAEDAGRMIAEGSDLEVCKAEVLGWDVAEELGIVKYEPPIPESMAGEVIPLHEHCLKFDVENWQKYPHLLEDGEEVVMTEKLHGCLHRDSMVMLPNGEERTISEIISLNIKNVLSYSEETKTYITRPITGTSVRKNDEKKKWVKISLENGRSLILTEDHPIFSRDRQSWIDAKDIQPNEDIESPIL